MPEFNFQEEIAIDFDNLHEDFRMHAHVRKKYADGVSYLEKVAKKAHEKVKVVRSKLIKEAKELKLSSDSLRESYYREHKDHKAAKNEQIDAEYELAMAWNALRAFDDRKYALENAVKLLLANYFATPREERNVEPGKRIMDEARGKTETKQRAALNPKRRTRKS